MAIETVEIRGIKVYPFKSEDELIDHVMNKPSILVAVNAEKTINADEKLIELINDNTGYCDGAGAVKALHHKGHKEAVRIPGCELWLNMIDRFHATKSFYLVGAKPGIVNEVVDRLRQSYPDINIAGFRDGYIRDNQELRELIDNVAERRPDFVFVAMGSPRQEMLMRQMQKAHPGAVYQGLGGSFDVYSGHQQRAPRWWQKHNLEFLYRFIITPSRLTRLGPYVRFAIRLYTNRL